MTSPNTRARAPLAGASLRLLGGRHQGFVVLPSRGGGERGEKFFSGKLAVTFTAKETKVMIAGLKKRLYEKAMWHDPAARAKKVDQRL